MTRRGLFTAAAVVTATALCLSALPMRMNALAAFGIWLGSVALSIVIAGALAAAMERHEHRVMYSQVLKEARRVLR